MLSKTYISEIDYSVEMHKIFDAWVWKGTQVPVCAVVDEKDGLECLGHLRPIRWWRRSIHRAGEIPVEKIVLCFAVKHLNQPSAKVGDYCGVESKMQVEIVNGVVSSVVVGTIGAGGVAL